MFTHLIAGLWTVPLRVCRNTHTHTHTHTWRTHQVRIVPQAPALTSTKAWSGLPEALHYWNTMERLTWLTVCCYMCVCVCVCVSDWGHCWLKCSVCDSDLVEKVRIMPKQSLITLTHSQTHLGIFMNHSSIHDKTCLHMQCFSPTIASHLHTHLSIFMISHTNYNNYSDFIDNTRNIHFYCISKHSGSHRPSIINPNIDFYLYCPLEAQSPSCHHRRL